MAWDARLFVSACPVCAAGKGSNRPPAGLLQPLSVPLRPWSHIAMDFVTGLPPSGGMTVVLTVVDRFSKAAHFIPLPKLPSARETATVVLDHIFRIHGLPVNVVSDRGPQFVSKFWTEFCRQLGATASLSSGYHPQTNGQAERANQDLERVLRCVASAEPSSWSSRLTMVEYAHNSLPVSSTGLSPFQCCLGYQPPLSPSQESDAIVPSAHSFRDASVLEGLLEKPSPGLARGTRRRRTVTVLSPHFTCVVRRSGCPLRTFPSDSSHVNWDPDSLDRSSSPKCSVRCLCDSNEPPRLKTFTRFFMYLRSNPSFALPFSPRPLPPRLPDSSRGRRPIRYGDLLM